VLSFSGSSSGVWRTASRNRPEAAVLGSPSASRSHGAKYLRTRDANPRLHTTPGHSRLAHHQVTRGLYTTPGHPQLAPHMRPPAACTPHQVTCGLHTTPGHLRFAHHTRSPAVYTPHQVTRGLHTTPGHPAACTPHQATRGLHICPIFFQSRSALQLKETASLLMLPVFINIL
jgi:hypothetical protein